MRCFNSLPFLFPISLPSSFTFVLSLLVCVCVVTEGTPLTHSFRSSLLAPTCVCARPTKQTHLIKNIIYNKYLVAGQTTGGQGSPFGNNISVATISHLYTYCTHSRYICINILFTFIISFFFVLSHLTLSTSLSAANKNEMNQQRKSERKKICKFPLFSRWETN